MAAGRGDRAITFCRTSDCVCLRLVTMAILSSHPFRLTTSSFYLFILSILVPNLVDRATASETCRDCLTPNVNGDNDDFLYARLLTVKTSFLNGYTETV